MKHPTYNEVLATEQYVKWIAEEKALHFVMMEALRWNLPPKKVVKK
jgi:hypothetical protein